MAYLNKVMLIGNIGKDPVISTVGATARKRVSFSLATSRRYKDNHGEQKELTDWHNIVGWGKIADVFEQLGVHKGMTLYVEGSITNRTWTDPTTNAQKNLTEVTLETFQLLSQRAGTGAAQGGGTAATQYTANNNPYSSAASTGYTSSEEDDLPF